MNLLNGHGDSITARSVEMPRFEPEFEVSWVGKDPIRGHYCFGSMDGRLLFLKQRTAEWLGPFNTAPSREAVNGVAFGLSSYMVSTRADMTCVRQVDGLSHGATIQQGAHGVCASSQGEYYAPAGEWGLLKLEPRLEKLAVSVLSPGDRGMEAYFYRVACLSAPDGREVLACSLRRGGFAVLPLRGFDPQTPTRLARTGLDIVDVCSLGVPEHPLAAVGLGIDCSLHLFRDAYRDNTGKTLRFPEIQDRAYRVLCADGHIFLLTNRRIYTFVGLAARFVLGITRDYNQTVVGAVEIEAVDMTLATNRTLLVIESDDVRAFEIEDLIGRQSEQISIKGAVSSNFSQEDVAWSDIPASSLNWSEVIPVSSAS